MIMERVVIPDEELLARVDYKKDVDKIYIKSVALDRNSYIKLSKILSMDERIEYLNRLESFKEFTVELPKGESYRRNSSEISLGSYPFGDYGLILSSSKNFDLNSSISSIFTIFQYIYIESGR